MDKNGLHLLWGVPLVIFGIIVIAAVFVATLFVVNSWVFEIVQPLMP